MSKDKIVKPQRPATELERFAMCFHQDWQLLYPDFQSGFAMYTRELPQERRRVLAKELRRFLDKNERASLRGLKKLWLKLGAQGWQADLNIRDTLEEFSRALERP